MRICVCGGGSVAHVAAAVLGAQSGVQISVLTRAPEGWGRLLTVHHGSRHQLVGKLAHVTAIPDEAIPSADLVLLAVPAFARAEVLTRIARFVRSDAWVGSLAGAGGFDWQATAALGPSARVFGLQRVPWVCRTLERGRLVSVTGVRARVVIAGHPAREVPELAGRLGALLGLSLVAAETYLAVTLAFDNPTLHPPRLYGLFGLGQRHRQRPLFYSDWDDLSSALLLQMDDDLAAIRRALGVNGGPTARAHFGVDSAAELSVRIRGIRALCDIPAPIVEREGVFYPDLSSRYFQEDLPYGVLVQRAVGELAGVATPAFDEILSWAQALLGTQFLDGSRRYPEGCSGLPVPQAYGIASIEELKARAGA